MSTAALYPFPLKNTPTSYYQNRERETSPPPKRRAGSLVFSQPIHPPYLAFYVQNVEFKLLPVAADTFPDWERIKSGFSQNSGHDLVVAKTFIEQLQKELSDRQTLYDQIVGARSLEENVAPLQDVQTVLTNLKSMWCTRPACLRPSDPGVIFEGAKDLFDMLPKLFDPLLKELEFKRASIGFSVSSDKKLEELSKTMEAVVEAFYQLFDQAFFLQQNIQTFYLDQLYESVKPCITNPDFDFPFMMSIYKDPSFFETIKPVLAEENRTSLKIYLNTQLQGAMLEFLSGNDREKLSRTLAVYLPFMTEKGLFFSDAQRNDLEGIYKNTGVSAEKGKPGLETLVMTYSQTWNVLLPRQAVALRQDLKQTISAVTADKKSIFESFKSSFNGVMSGLKQVKAQLADTVPVDEKQVDLSVLYLQISQLEKSIREWQIARELDMELLNKCFEFVGRQEWPDDQIKTFLNGNTYEKIQVITGIFRQRNISNEWLTRFASAAFKAACDLDDKASIEFLKNYIDPDAELSAFASAQPSEDHANYVKVLLEMGADPLKSDNGQPSPVEIAISKGHYTLFKLYVEAIDLSAPLLNPKAMMFSTLSESEQIAFFQTKLATNEERYHCFYLASPEVRQRLIETMPNQFDRRWWMSAPHHSFVSVGMRIFQLATIKQNSEMLAFLEDKVNLTLFKSSVKEFSFEGKRYPGLHPLLLIAMDKSMPFEITEKMVLSVTRNLKNPSHLEAYEKKTGHVFKDTEEAIAHVFNQIKTPPEIRYSDPEHPAISTLHSVSGLKSVFHILAERPFDLQRYELFLKYFPTDELTDSHGRTPREILLIRFLQEQEGVPPREFDKKYRDSEDGEMVILNPRLQLEQILDRFVQQKMSSGSYSGQKKPDNLAAYFLENILVILKAGNFKPVI